MASSVSRSSSILLSTFDSIIADPSFYTVSEEASEAVKAAKRVKDRCEVEGNNSASDLFSKDW